MIKDSQEVNLNSIKSRAVRGVVVLTGRTFLLSTLSLIATGFLTVFLNPSEFGVFWIVSAIVSFLAYFSDVGLAAALIQKKEKPTDADLKTTFTIQQVLVLLILLILFLLSPRFIKIYSLDRQATYLMYALGFSLFLSSLKTIPSVLMERELEFEKLVFPQILENLFYNIVAVFFAWKGLGVQSFTYAVLVRGFVGLIAIYILKPWIPGIAFSGKSLKKLLNFGLPYQANTFLATIKDDGMTAFLGSILGPAGIGYLGWAQKWAYAPLRFFMDHVTKVTFPAFARMQDEKEELKRTVTHSIFFICFLVFPTLIGLLVLAPIIVKVIPKYEKWTPALLALSLIGINTVLAAITTQLTNLLNSIGKIKITFGLMIMWTVLTWIFVPILAVKYGVNGAALGYSIVGLSSLIAIFITKKYVNFDLYEAAVKPAFSTVIMAVVLLVLRKYLPIKLTSVFVITFVGFVVYAFSSYLISGQELVNDIKKGLRTFFSKKDN